MQEVGILGLNRNPANYFAEVDQSAFSPGNVVPGIGHSPDKMLQFRVIAYADAHHYRLGINAGALPVNKPRCPVHHYHCDGAMRFDDNSGGGPNYKPNSFGGPKEDPRFKEPPLKISGDADRYNHREGNDDYTQASNLFRLLPADEKTRLLDAMAGAMQSVPEAIQRRWLAAYGAGLMQRLGPGA